MSKFKEFIKKVASKFSTPVKPLAAEVFKEEKFKIDTQGNVKASDLKLNVTVSGEVEAEGLKYKVDQLIVDWRSVEKMVKAIEKGYKIKQLQSILTKTKSNRIKKKIQKRINTYGKNPITRN
ncbi:hypothetical protein [Paenibacillus sp. 1781tsa1]|uniref:hypothetical protein n=1 Tax=Paenibacillus sp. 1781tsa1 TaxID=2953810 RepID=UPI00209DF911|nr:hypothetical protein [Paenibacillus sp. 1781tsa1]MCP1185018.1 hypothetical protein [Paenibacillus sp. 1781tsa1]